MNTTTDIERQELKNFIDVIPKRSFEVVRNFLSYITDTAPVFNEPLVIEPADADEIAMIEEGMREYENNPSSFTD